MNCVLLSSTTSRQFVCRTRRTILFNKNVTTSTSLISKTIQRSLSSSSSDDGNDGGSSMFNKIGFLGAGKMAQAMIKPLITTKLQDESKISIYDVSTSTIDNIQKDHPTIGVSNSIQDLCNDCNLIVCAVKPQNLDTSFFNEINLSKNLRDDATLLSVVAGKPISFFLNGLNNTAAQNGNGHSKLTKITRSMPNTPAQIGQGVTVWTCTNNITLNERDLLKKVLSCFGKSIFVDDESFIDMSTSISGSGPAYIFMLMEAMIDAGVHMGFSRDTATTLTYHTLLGSTLYAMETRLHPAILRNLVTSPAGTTASAMYELENGKFRTVIKDAIWACYRRSLEMGGKDSNVGPGRVTFIPTQPPTFDTSTSSINITQQTAATPQDSMITSTSSSGNQQPDIPHGEMELDPKSGQNVK